jgi:PAS domain S-box-containing protein
LPDTTPSYRPQRWFLPALALVFLLLLIGGRAFYHSEQQDQIRRTGEQLLAIAELKSQQITEWRRERINDAQILAKSRQLVDMSQQWLAQDTPEENLPLPEYLRSLQEIYSYADVILLDPDSNLRLSVNGDREPSLGGIFIPLEFALKSGQAVMTDFHASPKTGKLYATLIVPLIAGSVADGRRIGTLLLQIDPQTWLFPSLKAWPLPTQTAETLLVRREEDTVLFLNDLRHPPSDGSRLQVSATLTQLPAVQAVFGGAKGIVEGNDYTGVPAIAAVQPVPDSPWYIVAKISREEALAGWITASRLILGLIAVLLLAILGVFGVLYQTRGLQRYRELFAAETATRTEQERFRVAFNACPLAASIARAADGRFIDVNDNYQSHFGWARSEMIGRTSVEIRLWPSDEARRLWVERLLSAGELLNHEGLWLDCFGRSHNVEISAAVINIDGEAHILAFASDVTERRKEEAELTEYRRRLEAMVDERTGQLASAKEEAERASRAKSAFLANMSHEIRTPLNAVIGLTYLIRRDSTNPQEKARLTRVSDSAEHLLSVINDILDISKIEAEKLHLETSDFPLRRVIAETLEMVEFRARDKHLALQANLGADLPEHLHGDPKRLQQVLLNYLSNAIKFTEAGHIRLSVNLLEKTDSTSLLRFAVEDSGIGIAPSIQDRLFRPFEQADDSTTRRFGGTGLGLAISRQLATMMGGETGMSSAPGQGSTFWMTARFALPTTALADTCPILKSVDFEAEVRRRHSGARILLVEDDPVNQEVAHDLLEQVGLITDIAENGTTALAMVDATTYDLILMDMQMPDMDGLEATRRILALPGRAATLIVALTANAFAEDRNACLEAGMVDHVTKPVSPAVLYSTLLRWLSTERAAASDTPQTQAPASVSAESTAALLANLGKLPELVDLKAGLASLNGKGSRYIDLLRKFVDHHQAVPMQLGECLQAGDLETARRLAHTQKGTAGTLGLCAIRHSAENLELAIRGGESAESLLALSAKLAEVHADTCRALQAALPLALPTAGQPVDMQAASQLLKRLQHLLAEDDLESQQLALNQEEMLRTVLEDEFENFQRELGNFDFPQALLVLEQALSRIAERLS